MSNNTRRAVARVKDRLREGALLMRMHTVHGKRWFVLPRRNSKAAGREVADEIAELVIREIDVFPRRDGMWPGHDQTFGMGEP